MFLLRILLSPSLSLSLSPGVLAASTLLAPCARQRRLTTGHDLCMPWFSRNFRGPITCRSSLPLRGAENLFFALPHAVVPIAPWAVRPPTLCRVPRLYAFFWVVKSLSTVTFFFRCFFDDAPLRSALVLVRGKCCLLSLRDFRGDAEAANYAYSNWVSFC